MTEHAQKKKWGIPMKTSRGTIYLSVIAFADNYWIFATSPAELKSITIHWLELLRMHGWHTPVDEICYCTTALDSQYTADIAISGEIIKRIPRKTGFKVLGTFVTFDNAFDVELGRRIRAAWSAFSKFACLLKCNVISLECRLRMLAKAVHPALFWCAGSWNLRTNQLSKLRDLQRKMLRKMIGFKMTEEETIAEFMSRTNTTMNNLMACHRVKTSDVLSHRAVFRWAGTLARISLSFPYRLTTRIFQHKDWTWIQTIAHENRGRQLHGRNLRTWRWERPLYKFFGENWQSQAADIEHWRSIEPDFLAWRSLNR